MKTTSAPIAPYSSKEWAELLPAERRRIQMRERWRRLSATDPEFREKQRERDRRRVARKRVVNLTPEQIAKVRQRNRKNKRTNNPWTDPETEAALEQQGYLCPISEQCLRTQAVPVPDHCHVSGIKRAILSREINAALGMFKDNPEWLRRAADYIERYRNTAAGTANYTSSI